MDSKLKGDLLGAFSQQVARDKDLPDTDPRKAKFAQIGEAFTSAVAFLRSPEFPSPAMNALMTLVWDIVGHKVVPVGVGPNVQTLSFAMAERVHIPSAMILVPHEWLDQIKADPVLQMGAVAFVGSQTVDFYNGKTTHADFGDMVKRARAYEAEYLSTIKSAAPDQRFNDYQEAVLNEFPQGLSSFGIRSLLYTPRPFVAPA
jgi:hypothetical protein